MDLENSYVVISARNVGVRLIDLPIGYEKLNSEVLLMVPLLYGSVTLYCASPEGLKQILNEPFKWVKPHRALSLGYASTLDFFKQLASQYGLIVR